MTNALRCGLLAIAIGAAGAAAADDPPALESAPHEPAPLEKVPPKPAVVVPEYEMGTFQWAFLVRAPGDGPAGEADAARLQAEHVEYLAGLVEAGKTLLVGPLADGGGIQGVVVLDAGSIESARGILEQDPLVRAGRLVPELHTWWAARGILGKPADLLDGEPCTLGLLKRPADAPDLPDNELRKLQAGHMANIEAMAATGELVIAGPMQGDGPLRGIFVFRGTDRAKIREMASRDPAIEKRRLELVLHELTLPRGTLPPRMEGHR